MHPLKDFTSYGWGRSNTETGSERILRPTTSQLSKITPVKGLEFGTQQEHLGRLIVRSLMRVQAHKTVCGVLRQPRCCWFLVEKGRDWWDRMCESADVEEVKSPLCSSTAMPS